MRGVIHYFSVVAILSATIFTNFKIENSIILFIFFALLGAVFIVEKKQRIYIYILLLFSLIAFSSNIRVHKEDFMIGRNYSFKIRKEGERVLLDGVDGKYSYKKIYLKMFFCEEENGVYYIDGKVKSFNKYGDSLILNISVDSWKRGYFSKYKTYLRESLRDGSKEHYKLYMFYKAIILGERDGLEKVEIEKFAYTGLMHILAISGLHIGVILLLLLNLFFRRVPYRLRYVLTGVVITLYILIISASPSAVRAYIMGMIYILSKIVYEKTDIKKSFHFSLIAMVLYNPSVIYSISFQLSFLAIFAIIYIYPILEREKRGLFFDIGILSISIQILSLPLVVNYFSFLPIYSFISSVILGVYSTVIIMLSFVALSLSLVSVKLATYFNFFMNMLLELFYLIVDFLVRLPYMQVRVDFKIPLFLIIVYYLGILLVVNWKKEACFVRERRRFEK